MTVHGKIGVFDSGYGGLTILKELRKKLPNYEYIYLGDNARAPYGTKSFDVVYQYTLECVEFLFSKGCELVILACNTASAKALRTIQQNVLPNKYPGKRVLGVIRPSTELVGDLTHTNCIGILATEGTVNSMSYVIELEKYSPNVKVYQKACPLWVPLIENNEQESLQGKEIIKRDILSLLKMNSDIDTVILGCTHFPLIYDFIKEVVGENIQVVGQGEIVANSLTKYLEKHKWMHEKLLLVNKLSFYTSENIICFKNAISLNGFINCEINTFLVK